MLQKLKIDRKLIKELDFGAIIVSIIIVLFGCVNILSAFYGNTQYAKLQITWLVLGLIVLYLILSMDYSTIKNYAALIYWASIILLAVNDVTGTSVKGATNWIRIGSRALQPSEFVKLGMTIMLAKKLDDMEGNINNVKNFFILCFYALIPMVLIYIEPDMGMTMVSFFIVLGIFFAAGLNIKTVIFGIASLIGLITASWNVGIIKPYMKLRITSLFDGSSDTSKEAYQRIQSIIAIGSGGILGLGFRKGTQTAGGYVPENYNDMIFSVIGEEWGFIGAIVLLVLYGILISKYIKIAKNSKDLFGSLICVGILSALMFSIFQNIGMAIGILPISGLTLPFVSYGGSSLLTAYIAMGLVLNVGMRKKKINF